MSTIVTETNTLPPVECTSWCEDGNGHTDASHPLDQSCMSRAHAVPLLREDPIEVHRGAPVLDSMRAYLIRERFEVEPYVEVCRGDSAAASMTLDEAEQYARHLLELVQAARA